MSDIGEDRLAMKPGDTVRTKSVKRIVKGNLFHLTTPLKAPKDREMVFIYLGTVKDESLPEFAVETLGLLGWKRMTSEENAAFVKDFEKKMRERSDALIEAAEPEREVTGAKL